MKFHTSNKFAGRTLVIGQVVLTATDRGVTWAKLTYLEEDENGGETPLFAVHFSTYPIPLEFVEGISQLAPGKWCWTPKPSA